MSLVEGFFDWLERRLTPEDQRATLEAEGPVESTSEK